jgi:hypothetical protein
MPAPPTHRKPSRAERTRRIRRLVVTWTVIAFVAAWAGIFVQMRAGDDPSLGTGTAAAALTTTTSTVDDGSGDAAAGTDDGYGEDDGGAGSSSSSVQPGDPGAVTSSQS